MGFHRQRTMWLWRNPDNVTHRQLLSIDQVWRRSTVLTWSRWGCRRLADNIWLLAHDNNNNNNNNNCAVPSSHRLTAAHNTYITVTVEISPDMFHMWCQELENKRLSQPTTCTVIHTLLDVSSVRVSVCGCHLIQFSSISSTTLWLIVQCTRWRVLWLTSQSLTSTSVALCTNVCCSRRTSYTRFTASLQHEAG